MFLPFWQFNSLSSGYEFWDPTFWGKSFLPTTNILPNKLFPVPDSIMQCPKIMCQLIKPGLKIFWDIYTAHIISQQIPQAQICFRML
jgi:hypothetical protein